MPSRNDTNFLQTEPPPHPEGDQSKPSPQGVVVGKADSQVQVMAQEQPVPPQEAQVPAPQKPVAKKGFPKIIIFAVGLFLVLGVLVFAFIRFRPTGLPLLGGGGKVVWWGIQYDLRVYEPLIQEFESQNPGITVRYEKQSEVNYRERLTNALASGEGPDILEIHNSWLPMFESHLSALPSSVMSKEEFEASFYLVIASDLTAGKGVVAMPLEYDALTLFINQDIFAEAARTAPETWDDFRTLATELTQKPEGVIIQSGAALGITENVDYWPDILALMFYQNRANLARPSLCGIPAEGGRLGGENCFGADAITFYKLFAREGVWDRTLPSSTLAFANGKLAMLFAPSRVATEILRINPNLRFRTVPLPQLPKNAPTDPDFSYATYWVQGVKEKSRSKEAAWKFLEFLASEESLESLYANIKSKESFGKVSPRPNMNLTLREDPILGSVVLLAPDSRSWYLADKTNDGPTGINTRINSLYAGVIDAWPPQGDIRALGAMAEELIQVLSSFGVPMR